MDEVCDENMKGKVIQDIKEVPFSNDTGTRRIEDLSGSVFETLISTLKNVISYQLT